MESLMPATDYAHAPVTEAIIGAFYRVYNEMGYGFLEKVYENAMTIALQEAGLTVVQQAPIQVHFAGRIVGRYDADLLVNDIVIVELKVANAIAPEHEAQLLNYLKATRYEVGLLLNFSPTKAEVKRKAFRNDRKGLLSWTEPSPNAQK
jgi:GxxExxY protein